VSKASWLIIPRNGLHGDALLLFLLLFYESLNLILHQIPLMLLLEAVHLVPFAKVWLV
jgi:hypothetical protein